MGRILEDHAKWLIARYGVPVPEGKRVWSSEEAMEAFTALRGKPAMIKALVPVGGRGKSGAIVSVADAKQAGVDTDRLLAMEIGGYPVAAALIEERIDIANELYISFSIDHDARQHRVMISTMGGIDIEEVAANSPELIVTSLISPAEGLHEFRARELWRGAGVSGPLVPLLGLFTKVLYRAFVELDAYLLEINPVIQTPEQGLIAGDAVLAIDDSAIYRHPEMAGRVLVGSEKVWRPLTQREEAVSAAHAAEPYRGSARYLELDGGDIGFLCGGGGASLLLYDALINAGGQPANYAEIGGNPTESKVAAVAEQVLNKPGVRGLFVGHNITNNTQVDVIARGITEALSRRRLNPGDFPVVAREAGLHDDEGRRIFEEAGIVYLGAESTLDSAAVRMVQEMEYRYGSRR